MTPGEIRDAVARLDTRSVLDSERAWALLKPLGIEVVPYLAEAYTRFKKSQGRVAVVFYSTRYARTSQEAFELGVAALNDKATLVRYRVCGLLAYSLRREPIGHLYELLNHVDQRTADDAKAAIDAIKNQNHHYFIDRHHGGNQIWFVNESDRDNTDSQPPCTRPVRQDPWWQFWK